MITITELINKVAEYGVKITPTLARFLNNEQFYEDCLKSFGSDPSVQEISDAIENEEYTKAFELAHAMKGVTANLGLDPLSEAVSDLVEELRAKRYDDLENKMRNILYEYNRFTELMS